MTEQELYKAKAISNRLIDLQEHLKSIEFVEEESHHNIKFRISTDDGVLGEDLKHEFIPLIPENFLREYKAYLRKGIADCQKEFDEL